MFLTRDDDRAMNSFFTSSTFSFPPQFNSHLSPSLQIQPQLGIHTTTSQTSDNNVRRHSLHGSSDGASTLSTHQHHAKAAETGSVMGSLRVIELQLVAFIMVFSASGLVPLLDLIFPAFVTAYLLLLSRLAFPSHSRPASSASASPELFQGSRTFRLYVVLGTTVGLFLPLAYVLGGFARGDDHAVRSATPHLFLLSFQILTENIISGLSLFSPPLRALVPLLYTVRRLFVIIDWTVDVWLNKTLSANAMLKDVAWFWFGKCLAAANLAYFAVNLFGFLIPCFLPRAFERYFHERIEIQGKATEDKRSTYTSKPTEKKSD